MGAVEAAFTKYAINTFLATKVTFFNQLYDAAQTMGAHIIIFLLLLNQILVLVDPYESPWL
jgi:hypothetical protein